MDSFVQRVQDVAIGGKYHLVRKLGSGSFGNVYLGCDAESGNEVAMKLENLLPFNTTDKVLESACA